jgi:hypothetical protein
LREKHVFFSIFDTRSFFSLITSFLFFERWAVGCGDFATARCRDLHSVAVRCDAVGLNCGVCACWEWADIYRVYEERTVDLSWWVVWDMCFYFVTIHLFVVTRTRLRLSRRAGFATLFFGADESV